MLLQLFRTAFYLSVLLNIGVSNAENVDPDDNSQHYAWGENVGWLNFEPQGDGGSGIQVYDEYLEGYIWSESIGWISVACLNDDSCAQVEYGVLNNGLGILSGFAWSENAGWINFSCENTQACDTAQWGVTIDNDTGHFQGYAWAENIGWISFSDTTGVGSSVVTSWRPTTQLDQQDEDDDPTCFLATIASGSYLQSQLNGVRRFRDRYLLSNTLGRWITTWYYRLSPAATRLVQSQQSLVMLSRWLATPIVYLVTHIKVFLIALLCGLGARSRRKYQSNQI